MFSRKDWWGISVSGLSSGALFLTPWLLLFAVGWWAEVRPATDIVVELYRPIEAVYLEIEPPPVEEEVGPPEEPVPEPAEEPLGAEDGAEDGEDAADDAAAGGDGTGDEAPEGAVDGDGPAPGEGGGGEGDTDGTADGEGDGSANSTKKKGKSNRCATPHPNVRTGADGIIEVDRTLVEYYTASLNRFMELGYSEPYERNGIKGFFIGGFGCTSPVYKAGLRRGDVLMTVNGKNTRTWVGVYLLYKKLRKETDFEVQVLRKGQTEPTMLRFRVVES